MREAWCVVRELIRVIKSTFICHCEEQSDEAIPKAHLYM